MRDVFSSLPGALREFAASDKTREAIVIAAWKRAVGTGLGEHTAPVQLDGKVLIVAVSSETWKKHIADLAGQILFKLNGTLGTAMVSFIEFTVDPGFVRKQNQPAVRSKRDAEWDALVADELAPELKAAANEIENETLRQLFLCASTSSLARQRSDRKKDS